MLIRCVISMCSRILDDRWLSVGSDLKFDARRDLDDVGAMPVEGKHYISFIAHILFLNYRTTIVVVIVSRCQMCIEVMQARFCLRAYASVGRPSMNILCNITSFCCL